MKFPIPPTCCLLPRRLWRCLVRWTDACLSGTCCLQPPRRRPPKVFLKDPTPPVRIVLLAAARHKHSSKHVVPDVDGGWRVVQGKGARRRVALPKRRRPVPAELHGRCFNCLSLSHRVADCRRATRCFKCWRPGHLAATCPGLGHRLVVPMDRHDRPSVWGRLSLPRVAAKNRAAGVIRHASVWRLKGN
jgi:hypothetical protein